MKKNIIIVTLILTAIFSASCGGRRNDYYLRTYRCNRLWRTNSSGGNGNVGKLLQKLSISSYSLWREKKIPVCWEEETFLAAYTLQREWTKKFIEDSWGKALDMNGVPEEEKVSFVGWEKCGENDWSGIRIKVSDERPYTYGVGEENAGVPDGMILNFLQEEWWCGYGLSQKNCLRAQAVHEFGHAIGLLDEASRQDYYEGRCYLPVSEKGNVYIGSEPDKASVMNGCSGVIIDGELSATDITGAQAAYYPGHFDFSECEVIEESEEEPPP